MTKDFTAIGRALSAPARSDVLNLLLDGSERPAGELAAGAGISPSTASEHLAVLLDAGLVTRDPSGRRRLYRLADGGVAAALEHLGHLCPDTPALTYRRSREADALAHARLCYDHLAGRLGVTLTAAMVTQGWLTGEDLTLTDDGRRRLSELGIDVTELPARRRITRRCADWTERQAHLAGALGAAIGRLFLDQDWVRRIPTGRGLEVTAVGHSALRREWGVSETQLPSQT